MQLFLSYFSETIDDKGQDPRSGRIIALLESVKQERYNSASEHVGDGKSQMERLYCFITLFSYKLDFCAQGATNIFNYVVVAMYILVELIQ